MDNQNLAERIILEIVRRSAGNEIEGKTRLFKAFYFAHLYYALDQSRCLTEWPIVRMPNGPGIDDFELLMNALKSRELVELVECHVGPYKSTKFRATPAGLREPALSPDKTAAVQKAIKFVTKRTGAQLSNITHDFSKSWNDAQDGEEMPIYLDLLSDDDYEKAIKRASNIDQNLRAAWG